jgi:hypothetical protein
VRAGSPAGPLAPEALAAVMAGMSRCQKKHDEWSLMTE